DSYGVEVQWEYPDLDQDVYFQVKVKDSFSERSSNLTQNHHLNISSMLFNAAHNRYYVNVTAVRGGEKSNSTKSDDFSYNKFATAKIKCYLDFPEVKLSPKDGKLHVQFTNPLQLYRNSPALRNLIDDLEYCIETDEGMNEVCETCQIKQNTSCEMSVVFSEHRGEYCIILTGNIEQKFFYPRSSCFTGDIRSYPPVTVYVYPVLGVVLTLLFITAVIMLLAKKCNSEMKKKVPSMFQHFFVSCCLTFSSKTLIQTECNIMQMLNYFLFFFTIISFHLSTCINAAQSCLRKTSKCSYVFTKSTAFVNMGLASGLIRIQLFLAVQNRLFCCLILPYFFNVFSNYEHTGL
uniref:Uncharacterized protein n=1 Tax=Sinocyclocheilus grahami TaxID=75366 RepID=A0A672NMY3_SINGR